MQTSSLAIVAALNSIGRRFIGGYRTRTGRNTRNNPPEHKQGNREVSRRLRQEIRALAKRAIEYINIGEGPYQRSEAVTVWDQLCSDPSEYAKFRKAPPGHLIEIRNNLQVDLGLRAA